MNTQVLPVNDKSIALAAELLQKGELVALPTETVYGIAADARNGEAVKKIFEAKGRPQDNPLIVHIYGMEMLKGIVSEVPDRAYKLAKAFWPGPLTMVMPRGGEVSDVTCAGLDTVGVRMPSHPVVQAVIKASGVAFAAPSANLSGKPSPTNAQDTLVDMDGRLPLILDGGESAVGVESTVVAVTGEHPMLLRPGYVTKEQMEEVLGEEVLVSPAILEKLKDGEVARSPGMKYKHYAPKAQVILVNGDSAAYAAFVNSQPGCYALCYEEDRVTVPKVPYGKATDDLSQARELFDALRRLDELGAKKVYARMPRKTGVGMAVYNRLIRAAAFRILDLTKPFLIGVTGPTGAGKGYVCRLLAQAGLHPVDCDRVYGQLTVPGAPLLQDLAAAFGQEIIKDGALDRKTLAAKAFATPAATEKLDQVTHPAVLDACVQQAKIPAVLDAPQLFESGADALCAYTLAVTAPEDTRLARIMERDGIDRAAARLRMQAQPAADFYTEKCTFTVTNDGRDIKSQVDRILEAIL